MTTIKVRHGYWLYEGDYEVVEGKPLFESVRLSNTNGGGNVVLDADDDEMVLDVLARAAEGHPYKGMVVETRDEEGWLPANSSCGCARHYTTRNGWDVCQDGVIRT